MKKRSITSPASEISSPSDLMVLRRGVAHLEPFNGSETMIAVRCSVVERSATARPKAILTVRLAGDSVVTRTITIPFAEQA
jgi:hypothetical protein